jgi:phage shock protein PspC (stress-responsive transcriptional regulator)
MKKTQNISLAGIAFIFDEDAYTALKAYIAELHRAYDSDPNGAEIITDIEGRIAELILSEQSYNQVVTLNKINVITAQLGSPEAESDNAPHTPAEPQAEIPRRLHRWREGRILGGVCVGMGKYWDINPLWLRLIFIAPFILMLISEFALDRFDKGDITLRYGFLNPINLMNFGWLTLWLIYIALWIVIPLARTPRQKLEGRGEKITSESIHRNFQANAEPTPEGRMRASRDAETADSGRSILLIILRIVAACTALWLLMNWCATIAVSLFSGTFLFSGGTVIDEGGVIPLLGVLVGIISIPWLVLIYLLAVFAFKGRIRGWVIGLLIGLCILITVICGVKFTRSPSPLTRHIAWNSIFNKTSEIAEIKSIIESIDDIDIDEMFDQIDELNYNGIHNVTHFSYEQIAEDGDTIMRHVIEFKNDNEDDVKIQIDASPDYSSATIEQANTPKTGERKKGIQVGPFKFETTTHNAVISAPKQITELDITPEE